jgi:hypothetical protein
VAAQNFPKFPKILKVFQFATGILWIVVKKIASLMFVSFFYLLMIFLVSFHFYCVSLRFISIVSRFVSFLLCLASLHFYCVSLRFISIVSRFASFLLCLASFRFVSALSCFISVVSRFVSRFTITRFDMIYSQFYLENI